MPDISFITTCMGRLEHLKRSLPTWVSQPRAEVVVVDYSCPDKCGDWVLSAHPGANVVRCENESYFRLCHARNQGAAVARGRWLCFVDADVLVAQEFTVEVRPVLDDRSFFVAEEDAASELFGTVVIPSGAFQAAGGYDEVIQGWGAEDHDLYLRLKRLGLSKRRFPSRLLTAIVHSDELRTRNTAIRDRILGWNVNRLYIEAKTGLWNLLQAEPDLDTRRSLYTTVRSTVLDGAGRSKVRLEIPLGSAPNVTRADVRQSLVLVLNNPSSWTRGRALRGLLARSWSWLRNSVASRK